MTFEEKAASDFEAAVRARARQLATDEKKYPTDKLIKMKEDFSAIAEKTEKFNASTGAKINLLAIDAVLDYRTRTFKHNALLGIFGEVV